MFMMMMMMMMVCYMLQLQTGLLQLKNVGLYNAKISHTNDHNHISEVADFVGPQCILRNNKVDKVVQYNLLKKQL